MTGPLAPSVLLAGFAPFGGESRNPSWDAVSALHHARIAGHRVEAFQLPVEFGTSVQALLGAIEATQPALVLCVGQAGGRAQVSIERVAINVDDARIPDNADACPIDVPVVAGGPAAYFATLPIKAMLAALRESGIPAEISQTAGTYVCNHVFYGLMHALAARPGIRGGFIHVPYAPAQAARHPGAASLAVEVVTEAMRIGIAVALATTHDRRISGGAEH